MKKLFWSLFVLAVVLFGFAYVSAETVEFPYQIDSTTQLKWEGESINISKVLVDDSIKPTNSIYGNLFSFFKLSGKQYDTWTGKALNYVKWIFNLLLTLIWFISVILIIFAFYLIFVTKSEEAVGKAKKILTGVAMAILILWAAWFITSLLFFLYGQIVKV